MMAEGGEVLEKPTMKKKGSKWVVSYENETEEFDDKESAQDYFEDYKEEYKNKKKQKDLWDKVNQNLGFR